MKLLLIRHGEPGIEDALTEKGKREAVLLASRLAVMDITEYFCSPLKRALETAEPTLKGACREATVCPWLQEFAIPIRQPKPEIRPVPWNWLPEDWLPEPRFSSSDAWMEHEAFREAGIGEAYRNVVSSFDALLTEHGYRRDGLFYRAERPNTDTLAFFTHFGLSCVLLSHLFHCSPMVLWHSLVMAPSSVTTLCTEEREKGIAIFRASSIGDISHLVSAGEAPSFAARFPETYGQKETE